MMYYSNPTPLDKKKHKDLKLKRQDNYAFTAESNSLPLAGFEFFQASRSFPIFFVKNADGKSVPIAILSFKNKSHDMGDKWQDAYVPAYVRRYPFVLSSDGIVLFDADAPHLQEEEGEALFEGEEAEATDTLKAIVDFLKTVDHGYQMTEAFCAALNEKDILRPFKGGIKVGESKINLDDLYVIDEQLLHSKLDEKDVNEWFKKGWLAWSHAHLHSLGSVNEVFKRAQTAAQADEAAEA